MPDLPLRDLDEILEWTEPLWEEVRGRRLFLTGGTGFIGSWLRDSFAHANSRLNLKAQLVVLTRQSLVSSSEAVQYWRGDIRDFDFPCGQFSFVIHGANPSASRQSGMLTEVIVAGAQRLLKFCAAVGVRSLLYLSSGAVCGTCIDPKARIREDCTLQPEVTGYGAAKRAAEELCLKTSSLAVKIARGFSFIGPRMPVDGPFAAGNFFGSWLDSRAIEITGDGTTVRSYLYASDLAAWLWTILLRGRSGGTYNVGSDVPVTILDLARLIAKISDPPLPVKILNRGSLASSYVPSIEHATHELALFVRTPLEEAIRRTADWYREIRT